MDGPDLGIGASLLPRTVCLPKCGDSCRTRELIPHASAPMNDVRCSPSFTKPLRRCSSWKRAVDDPTIVIWAFRALGSDLCPGKESSAACVKPQSQPVTRKQHQSWEVRGPRPEIEARGQRPETRRPWWSTREHGLGMSMAWIGEHG